MSDRTMTRASIILAAVLASGTAGAETLFTQSEGGTVSLVQGLDAKTCDVARLTALGLPATDEEKAAAEAQSRARFNASVKWADAHGCKGGWGSTSTESFVSEDGTCFIGRDITGSQGHTVQPGDIRKAECLK